MRIVAVLGLVALLQGLSVAKPAVEDIPKERKYTVGFGAGMVGGAGLSAERWFSPRNGLRLTCAPYFNEEKYPEPDGDNYYYPERISGSAYDGFLSLGGLFLHSVAHFRRLDILSFAGGNYLGTWEKNDYETRYDTYDSTSPRRVKSYQETSVVTVGGGVGARLNFWRIDLSMLIGMAGAYDVTHELRRLHPSVDLGAHFHL